MPSEADLESLAVRGCFGSVNVPKCLLFAAEHWLDSTVFRGRSVFLRICFLECDLSVLSRADFRRCEKEYSAAESAIYSRQQQ